MKILVTAATEMEMASLKKLVAKSSSLKKKIHFHVTGVGMTATAYHLTVATVSNKYNLAVNIGLAGSFKKKISIGDVVHVTSDCFADLGAENQDGFLTLTEIDLQKKNQFPFRNEKLVSTAATQYPALKHLKQVNAISVNTVHGNIRRIRKTIRKFNPDIETMEGASFFYVCMLEKIPCVQIRAISNYVERRNKDKWNIPLALKNLTSATFDFLKSLDNL